MRKSIKLILILVLILFSNNKIYSKGIQSDFEFDMSSTWFEKNMYIQGINKDKCLISYITRFLSSGRGDYLYSYIIYDYKNNKNVEIINQQWIAKYYDEIAIDDWEDKKYSVNAYKKIIEDIICQTFKKFQFEEFNYTMQCITDCKILLKERKRLSRWTENISYEIKFEYNNNEYQYIEMFDETDIVKNISEITCYEAGDYLLFIQKIARDYFEDDDYYDYILRGIKK